MTSHGRPASPPPPIPENHVAPAPRRVRGLVEGEWLFDTCRALYVWEHPNYPRYYLPDADVRADRLFEEGKTVSDNRGRYALYSISTTGRARIAVAKRVIDTDIASIENTWRFDWGAIDHWFEEDEEIFVHPRSPYARVDAVASGRPVRVEAGGTVLASSPWCVMVFETGLRTRYYLPKTAVEWTHLSFSETVTQCPYKGVTSRYWSLRLPAEKHDDVAWCYDFPTREVSSIAGLIAFYDEKVNVTVG